MINTIAETKRKFDVNEVRKDFPILTRMVNDKLLVYLDNAATSQKPQVVIDALTNYYTYDNANIHRGLYFLSELATEKYEDARLKVKEFINALSTSEIIFVKGATEAINLVASSLCRAKFFKEGDEVIVSNMEHHANIVPWQLMGGRKNLKLSVIPITDSGELDMEAFENMISEKTRLVSVVHISNSLGTINPVKKIIEIAHSKNIPVLLDGAQSIPHCKVDLQELDADFYVFSGHKVFGPTGIGVLYGKAEFLDMMPPYQGGGDMIRTVTFEKTTFDDIPRKFEAGTPNIAGGIGLGAAIDYVNQFDRNDLVTQENLLLEYATKKLSEIEGLRIIGTAKEKASVVSFVIEGIHPYDIGTIIDTDGIAIRTGHHCTQPIMQRYNLSATARASFAFYNTLEEIDKLVAGLLKVKKNVQLNFKEKSQMIDKGELEQKIIAALKTCFDPEIPVDIWELGLIYEIKIDDEANAYLKMTLTSPNCPVAGSLPAEVREKVQRVKGVKDVYVDLVWEPAWGLEKMSEEAKLELGYL